MSEVMCQRDGFAKFFVQSQTFADSARNLRNFNAVRQPRTVVFAFVIGENLRFAVQPAGKPTNESAGLGRAETANG